MMHLASTLKGTASTRPECHPHSSKPRSIAEAHCDRFLVSRAKCGEERAFNELVSRYRQKVLALSMRYTGNQADAEDAVQNTFLKAYRALARFRGDCAFYSWLHRIAINSARTTRLLRMRDARMFHSIALNPETAQEAEIAIDLDTPEALVLTEEIRDAVDEAIDSLCEEQRIAISLRELHGLSYAEVASSMSCPVGTVRSRVFRARETIDDQLRPVLGAGLGGIRKHPAQGLRKVRSPRTTGFR
jgi:RNA polymerase sigma-70 factor (ECF subfamily)